jgi:hypothetical protein
MARGLEFRVIVESAGKRIGSMDADAFVKAAKCPRTMFLDTCVSEFNAWKVRIGEPERARVEVSMPTKARRRRIK